MRILYTTHEGGFWYETDIDPLELNDLMYPASCESRTNYPAAIQLKRGLIYDNQLMMQGYSPWRNLYSGLARIRGGADRDLDAIR